MDHPILVRNFLVEVPSYDVLCALISSAGVYGLDFLAGIDTNPSSKGPIIGM